MRVHDADPGQPAISEVTAGGFDGAVIISPYFWNFGDGMWQTTHHVALQLARRVPTIFVEPSPAWNIASEQFRVGPLARSLFGRRVRRAAPNLMVYARCSLPGGRLAAIRAVDFRRNVPALRRVMARTGVRRPLLWHSFPYWSERWIDEIDHACLVYHCLDHSNRVEEERIIRRADAVFCVSESLVEKHRPLNPRTHLLPNGVDLDLFDHREAARAPRPADLPRGRRLIGFVGSINCHVDLELVEILARRFVDEAVVLIGRVFTNETAPRGRQAEALVRLKSLANVHLLGFKPTSHLSAYVSAFDVCLVPFLANPFNRECDPLKFYQYLALGKPIVATADIPVVERYREVCYPAATHEEFVAQTAAALGEGWDRDLIRKRLQIARAHSWSAVVQRALAVLDRETVAGVGETR